MITYKSRAEGTKRESYEKEFEIRD